MPILKNNLYTINRTIETSETRVRLGMTLNPDHPIFIGHFPGFPITPGAAMVEMVKEQVSEYLGQGLRLVTAKQVKFLEMMAPDDTAELELGFELDRTCSPDIFVKAHIKDEYRTFMQFNGRFSPNF